MWLLKLIPGVNQLLNSALAYLNKRVDAGVVMNTNAKDVSADILQAEVSRDTNVKDMTLAMMDHPVFWVAWGLGVIPVLLYHACIFFVSTVPALGWTVLKVPTEEIEYGRMVVGSVFTLTGVSTVVSGLAHAWLKRA